MARFAYKGINTSMKSVSGSIDASDRKTAITMLRAQGVNVTSLEEGATGTVKKSAFSFSLGVSKGKMALNFLEKFLQLHAGGLAVGDSIKVMRIRLKNPYEKALAEAIHKDISEGKTIAASMRSFPDIFNENMVCMIEAGEKTGNLIPVIRNLIEFLQTKQAIKKKFISGMAYPATVCVIGAIVTAIFLIFVMPRLQNMLSSLGGELPLIARCLMKISKFSMQYWWVVLGGAVLFTAAFYLYCKTALGKFNIHKWSIDIPVIGMIIRENFYCQTANLLATLLGSGINTTESMTLAENASGNLFFRKRFVEAKKMVLDGLSMTQAFERNEVFPDLGLDLLSVGENTGDLASSFREVFKIYHTTLLDHLNMLTAAVTAIAMGTAFSMVTVLALSVITSVLKMTSSMKM